MYVYRCFKHHLNSTFRSNPEIKQCPAPTIATLLNHVLGGSAPAGAVGAPRADVEVEEVVPKSSVEVKKKKKKSKPAAEGSSDILSKSTSIPENPDAGGERAHCLEQLHSLAKSRFCLKNFALMAFTPPDLTTFTSTTTALDSGSAIPAEIGAPDKTAEPPTSTPFLNERISKLTLLRRLCQVRQKQTIPTPNTTLQISAHLLIPYIPTVTAFTLYLPSSTGYWSSHHSPSIRLHQRLALHSR